MRDAPIPGAKNKQEMPGAISAFTQCNLNTILTHHYRTSHIVSPPPLSDSVIDKMLPAGATQRHRNWKRNHIKQLTDAVTKFVETEKKGLNEMEEERCSSSTSSTHFDILHDDFIVLMSTINGGLAVRGKLFEIFADVLKRSGCNEDIYNIFLKTRQRLRAEVPDQISELRSTLDRKLCLRNIFKPSNSNNLVANNIIFGCFKPQNRLVRQAPNRQTI